LQAAAKEYNFAVGGQGAAKLQIQYFCLMKTKRILFVCLGNICRSPAAEAVFKKMAADQGLAVEVDSAGTSAWHAGELADSRMRRHAKARDYNITSISRPFDATTDFDGFDLIVAMDDNNFYELKKQASSPKHEKKVVRMRDFLLESDYDHIPDPYYGGASGFDLVIDLLEDGSTGLIKHLRKG
jgi:protein-tyrosine phosphatase